MSEMVEKVAYALYESYAARQRREADGDVCYVMPYHGCKNDMLEDAKAAIAAMREPTEDMIGDNDCAEQPGHAKEIWQDMIDAALK